MLRIETFLSLRSIPEMYVLSKFARSAKAPWDKPCAPWYQANICRKYLNLGLGFNPRRAIHFTELRTVAKSSLKIARELLPPVYAFAVVSSDLNATLM